MARRQLDNLVTGGSLKHEVPAASEIEGLIHSGETRLRDAENAPAKLRKEKRMSGLRRRSRPEIAAPVFRRGIACADFCEPA
jgi:hypothetical protein